MSSAFWLRGKPCASCFLLITGGGNATFNDLPTPSRKRKLNSSIESDLRAALEGTHTIERELGGGGMSRLFLARELRFNRLVVVKVLSPRAGGELSAERFQREIAVAANLQHPNIVPVLTAGEAGGLPF